MSDFFNGKMRGPREPQTLASVRNPVELITLDVICQGLGSQSKIRVGYSLSTATITLQEVHLFGRDGGTQGCTTGWPNGLIRIMRKTGIRPVTTTSFAFRQNVIQRTRIERSHEVFNKLSRESMSALVF